MAKLICTHSGSFHADDALGVAILKTLYPDAVVVRSRDPEVWASADILVDVGGEHSVSSRRFDHHQKGFNLHRADGTPFAGAGLVWAAYGNEYIAKVMPRLGEAQRHTLARMVDERLIKHADAFDNGIEVGGPFEFGLAGLVNNFNGTWLDGTDDDDARFAQAWQLAGTVLKNIVLTQGAELQAEELVKNAKLVGSGRILVLDVPRVPYERYVAEHMTGVLFAVYPESRGQQYQVRVIPEVLGQFKARADLPLAWAGLRDSALAAITGVPDAVFCHNGRFIAGAGSKAGALALAELALAAVANSIGAQPSA